MSNVVSMGRSCEYLVSRAARHRRAGRYDEAMALLSKAKTQHGLREEIELEFARVYDEIGCEEESDRAYLRIVRLCGVHKAEALFHLSVSSMQRMDMKRARSYFRQIASLKSHEGVSDEALAILDRQMQDEQDKPYLLSKKGKFRRLEKKCVSLLQQGKTASAKRAVQRALLLYENARGYTLLACCCLLRNEMQEAASHALTAHRLSPHRVQTLCVLADACIGTGDHKSAKKYLYLASLHAKAPDDLYAVAMESAKHGEDQLTLLLTRSLLRREPYHTKGMMIRACALVNLGRMQAAGKLFGRLRRLLPEDTVCSAYYRMVREGNVPSERLSLGTDVTRQEGIARSKAMVEMLYEDPASIRAERDSLKSACDLCTWAIRSTMTGPQTTTIALIILTALNTDASNDTLMDILTDPVISDSIKTAVLQSLTSRDGFKPYDVDFNGQLVKLAASDVSVKPLPHGESNAKIVQRVADALSPSFPDAARILLPIFLRYAERFGLPKRKQESAFAAALEYTYHTVKSLSPSVSDISGKYAVSHRQCSLYIQRLVRLIDSNSEVQTE